MSSTDESDTEEVDFDKFRKNYESYEHWELRKVSKNICLHFLTQFTRNKIYKLFFLLIFKAFLEAYWNKIPENELHCLAQTFINVELLGCKYPPETMKQIVELANNIQEVKDYRESRRNKLKRTFIGAQDASQAKFQKTEAPRQLENNLNDWSEKEKIEIDQLKQDKPMSLFSKSQKSEHLRSLLKDVIYFEMSEEDVNGSLNKTLACMQKLGNVTMKYDAGQKKFFYIFGGQIIGEGSGDTKKTAKKLADENLAATIKANCYTIKHKLQYYSAEDVVQPRDGDVHIKQSNSGKLQEDNVGFKMLKMLGWSGGGLGSKENEGIVDPVNLEIKIGRKGLGAESNEKFDQKYIRNLLKNFKDNQVEYDLVFSNEFTKEERAQIHQ